MNNRNGNNDHCADNHSSTDRKPYPKEGEKGNKENSDKSDQRQFVGLAKRKNRKCKATNKEVGRDSDEECTSESDESADEYACFATSGIMPKLTVSSGGVTRSIVIYGSMADADELFHEPDNTGNQGMRRLTSTLNQRIMMRTKSPSTPTGTSRQPSLSSKIHSSSRPGAASQRASEYLLQWTSGSPTDSQPSFRAELMDTRTCKREMQNLAKSMAHECVRSGKFFPRSKMPVYGIVTLSSDYAQPPRPY